VQYAIPPFDIDEDITERVGTINYPYTSFRVAPHLRRFYPGLIVADGFLLDEPFYSRYSVFRTLKLPTGDMVQKALPEGVLEPGGKVSGFLYFPELESSGAITFAMDLQNARTRASFGKVTIPFVVR
jgi:hypothetical protein